MTIRSVTNAAGDVLPEANTYALVKARFEQEVMSVSCGNAPERFFMIEKAEDADDSDLCQFLTASAIKTFYRNVWYWRPPVETGEDRWTEHAFAQRWLKDDTRRRVTRVVCDPIETPEGAFNRWSAMRAERLPPVPDTDVAALVEPILRHVREVLASDDDDLAEFVIDFVCNLIQRPGQPARVGLVLKGPYGCGKRILLAFLRNGVLGDAHYCETHSHDLLKRSDFGVPHKVLVHINEGFERHIGALYQTLAWETVTTHRSDVQRRTEVRNVCNLVFTTSLNGGGYNPPRYAESFVEARCSFKAMDNVGYFPQLAAHLRRDDVARAMYQFAMARDLSRLRPDFRRFTPQYLALSATTSDGMALFMSALVNAAPTQPIAAKELYEQYAIFSRSGDNATVFGKKMRAWKHAVQKRRTRAGFVYCVAVDALRATLVRHNEYHADVALFL